MKNNNSVVTVTDRNSLQDALCATGVVRVDCKPGSLWGDPIVD